MQWIITKDHINGKPGDDTPPRVGVFSSNRTFREAFLAANSEAKPSMLEGFKSVMNYEFRLYDDDGELYYEGLCLELDQQDDDSAFEPLDWAEADAGCTRMDYRRKGDKEWKTL